MLIKLLDHTPVAVHRYQRKVYVERPRYVGRISRT